jgi:D-glycero-D-manno-heptose 1,7-bisphosphate phosphatase
MGIDAPLRRAVFLDRDGVINRPVVRGGKPFPPATLEELEILPGVADALARLRSSGFRLIVVTNQPDVARGIQTREVVEAMHARLVSELPLDEFRVCFHDEDAACACRKPKTGLLEQAAADQCLSLRACYLIGDRWRDIEAGRAAECATVFIDYHYAERRPEAPDAIVSSLAEAADWILGRREGRV